MSLLILSLQPAPTAAFIRAFPMKGMGDKYDAFIFLHIKAFSSGCFLPKWQRIVQRTTRSENFFNEDITLAAYIGSQTVPVTGSLDQSQSHSQENRHFQQRHINAVYSDCLQPQRSDPFSVMAALEHLCESHWRLRWDIAVEMVSIKGREWRLTLRAPFAQIEQQ